MRATPLEERDAFDLDPADQARTVEGVQVDVRDTGEGMEAQVRLRAEIPSSRRAPAAPGWASPSSTASSRPTTARSQSPAARRGNHRERLPPHRRAGSAVVGRAARRARRIARSATPSDFERTTMTAPTRAEIVALDKRRVWHPYTEMGTYIAETDPLVIARAEGSRLFDVDGRRYLDANSSWWSQSLGHNHPRLVAAARAPGREDVPLCARRDHAPRSGAVWPTSCARRRRPGSRACSSATTGRPRSRWR